MTAHESTGTLPRTRILFVEGNQDGTVGGSFFSLLFLASGLDRTRFEPIAAFCFDNPLIPRFNESGVGTMVLPPGRPVVLPTPPGRILAKAINFAKGFVMEPMSLARFLRAQQIDILHLNNSITSNHVWMLAAKYAGVRCVTHERGINAQYSRRSRWLAKHLDAIICISKAVEDNFARAGLGNLRLVRIPNGLDPRQMRAMRSRDDILSELGVAPGTQVIGIVGNLKRWKGQDVVLRAMATLVQRDADVSCLIIGDNADANRAFGQEIQSLIRDLGLGNRVVITGYRPDVADYVNALDILVHASVLPEPFGRVLLEAMALSKPVVASRDGAVPEIVVHGETGLLFEPGDPIQLADCLASLVADRDRAQRMGRAGHERLLSHFGIDKNVRKTTELYETLLSA